MTIFIECRLIYVCGLVCLIACTFPLAVHAEDSAIPTGRVTLDDYTRVNVSSIWSAYSNLDLIFAVDNLLDSDYEETIGNTAVGIVARFQLRGKF